ncbi:hypothetical protein HID58_047289 [Brassica napus]|uniref:Uncharacterized protein n=1 Tax=Brassica napus TaxID=3708 RepID=A0ABQ8AYR8_BRANA|nr:hypothetical protein HID58_047289 [Brassica napus]
MVTVEGHPIKFQVWDTVRLLKSLLDPLLQRSCRSFTCLRHHQDIGKALSLRMLRESYIHFGILRGRETFNHLTNWLEDSRQHANPNMSIMLIGKKCDLAHKRAVSKEEGGQFAKENGLLFLEASARTAQNVVEVILLFPNSAFIKTATKILQNIQDDIFDVTNKLCIKVGYGRPQGAAGGRDGAISQGGGCCG